MKNIKAMASRLQNSNITEIGDYCETIIKLAGFNPNSGEYYRQCNILFNEILDELDAMRKAS